MEKEIYTKSEALFINAMVRRQEREDALKTKKTTTSLLELDEMLLKMEQQANMMDGIKMEEWIL